MNTLDPVFVGVTTAIRTAAKGAIPEEIEPEHCFIADLGFDSMSIALLALALESEFDRTILLDGWIARHMDPSDLTVASLCAYLREVLSDERKSVRPPTP